MMLDVNGRGDYLINLDLVRRIDPEDLGREYGHITFVYANGDEDSFKITSDRLATLLGTLHETQVV